jgi:hypothetical protein
MRFAVLGMLMLFALGDGCSSTPNVVGVQDYGSVTGRVLDAMTNKPIPSALVSVGSLYTAQADARGGFVVTVVPVGDQTVTARSPGYETASTDVVIKKSGSVDAGYIRLVPTIHPEGQATLAPPATPTPATPTPGPAASASPAGAAPAASSSPTPGASP